MRPLHKTALLVIPLLMLGSHQIKAQTSFDWQLEAEYPISTQKPGGLWFADVNNDGHQDIFTRHYYNGKITQYLSNADGSYQERAFASLANPRHIEVADFDNDGLLDLAVMNADGSGGGINNRMSVYLNPGDGLFEHYDSYITYGSYTYYNDSGDLNGDGFVDLVISSAGWDGFSVMLNQGNGTFVKTVHYNSGMEAYDIQLADMNGDGILDVVLPCAWNRGEVDIFEGKGDGTFGSRKIYMQNRGTNHIHSGVATIKIADLDGKNGLDAFVRLINRQPNGKSRYAAYILTNNGQGELTDTKLADDLIVNKILDIDQDGDIDAIAAKYEFTTVSTFLGYVLLENDGNGQFTESGYLREGEYGHFEDLNNDGRHEFISLDNNTQKLNIYSLVTPAIVIVPGNPANPGNAALVCEHAVYSPEEGTINVPVLALPTIDGVGEHLTGDSLYFSMIFKIMKNSPDRFVIKEAPQLLDSVNTDPSCHVVYDMLQQSLHFPFIDVPVFVVMPGLKDPVLVGYDTYSADARFLPISKDYEFSQITKIQ